jgi:hypothetical protein
MKFIFALLFAFCSLKSGFSALPPLIMRDPLGAFTYIRLGVMPASPYIEGCIRRAAGIQPTGPDDPDKRTARDLVDAFMRLSSQEKDGLWKDLNEQLETAKTALSASSLHLTNQQKGTIKQISGGGGGVFFSPGTQSGTV